MVLLHFVIKDLTPWQAWTLSGIMQRLGCRHQAFVKKVCTVTDWRKHSVSCGVRKLKLQSCFECVVHFTIYFNSDIADKTG
jgi:hypothetical protein